MCVCVCGEGGEEGLGGGGGGGGGGHCHAKLQCFHENLIKMLALKDFKGAQAILAGTNACPYLVAVVAVY